MRKLLYSHFVMGRYHMETRAHKEVRRLHGILVPLWRSIHWHECIVLYKGRTSLWKDPWAHSSKLWSLRLHAAPERVRLICETSIYQPILTNAWEDSMYGNNILMKISLPNSNCWYLWTNTSIWIHTQDFHLGYFLFKMTNSVLVGGGRQEQWN